MPTGSGKTYTAVRWVIENVISRGEKILWVAHRHELLEQAAAAFDRAIFLAEPKEKHFRRRIVSGRHCSSSQIGPGDDILICSVASLARRPDIVESLLSDHFLVIDEAHHAPAKSYRDLIRRITTRGKKHLLGLTATPTRTVESERPELTRIFGSEPIYEVGARDLIDTGFLANPVPVRVQTKSDVEEGLTYSDIVHLQRFGDLSEDWMNRIAHLSGRNKTIINHYLEHRKKYGKTLIFAINVLHANLLRDALGQAGVHAECVTSYSFAVEKSPEPEVRTRQDIIEAFQDANSDLNVLINVMILTEGFDVPQLQTVFLTRPTQSEILFRQMVGRALRGPKAGGTNEAFLVSFEDHWEQYRELGSPFGRLTDILPPEEIIAPADRQVLPKVVLESGSLPYQIISAVAAEIRRIGRSQPVDVFEAVPHGWFILEQPTTKDAEEQDAKRDLIHIY
jgi:ATP-dependent helicase IRC3